MSLFCTLSEPSLMQGLMRSQPVMRENLSCSIASQVAMVRQNSLISNI